MDKRAEKTSKWDINDKIHSSRFEKCQRMILEEFPGNDHKLLDIGCNEGIFCVQFLKRGWQCYGIDIRDDLVKKAKEKGVKAVVYDVSQKIPAKSNFFDAVFIGELLDMVEDTDSVLDEINRVLKRNGILVVTVPNLTSLRNRFTVLFGEEPWPFVDGWKGDQPHLRVYTLEGLKKQLRENGFKFIKADGVGLGPFNLLRKELKPVLTEMFPSLSNIIIAKAKKA